MDASEDQEDRDHEATEKKIKDALERGDAPVSHDLTLLGTLLSIYAFLKSISHFISSDQVAGMALLLEGASRFRIVNGADAVRLASSVAGVVSQPVLAAVAIALAVSTAVGAAPQRPSIVRRRVRIDPTRLDPTKGVDRLFGRKALATFGKVILKGAVALVVLGYALWLLVLDIPFRTSLDSVAVVYHAMKALEGLALNLSATIAIIAVVDLVVSRVAWRKKMRMSRQEVRDELKQAEGDPLVRMRMRSLALSRARKRMLSDVSSATMVVTNPTHFAIALRYRREAGGTPVVVAKGQELIAHRIRSEAEKCEIPIVEQPQLARAMYRSVEVGQAIPAEFYRAVAEIVNFLSAREASRRRAS